MYFPSASSISSVPIAAPSSREWYNRRAGLLPCPVSVLSRYLLVMLQSFSPPCLLEVRRWLVASIDPMCANGTLFVGSVQCANDMGGAKRGFGTTKSSLACIQPKTGFDRRVRVWLTLICCKASGRVLRVAFSVGVCKLCFWARHWHNRNLGSLEVAIPGTLVQAQAFRFFSQNSSLIHFLTP